MDPGIAAAGRLTHRSRRWNVGRIALLDISFFEWRQVCFFLVLGQRATAAKIKCILRNVVLNVRQRASIAQHEHRFHIY